MGSDRPSVPVPVDMSPRAIAARLREVSELRRLGLSLLRARRIGSVERDGSPSVEEGEPPFRRASSRRS